MRRFWDLLKTAAAGWWDDRAMSLGAAIAFFTIFSLAPVLLAAIAVAGLAFGREAAQGAIVREVGGLVGEKGGTAVETMIASASNFGSGVIGTLVGVLTFLVAATGGIVELQDDLNLIWKARRIEASGLLNFIRTRLLSFTFMLGIGFLLLVSLVIDAGLSSFGGYLQAEFSGAPLILGALNQLVGLAIAALLFAMIFKLLPSVDVTWGDVCVGAAGTAVLFTAGKFLIGFYLGQTDLASSFGAAASVMTLLLWIYYCSLILLFGAEFTKAYAESRGSHASADKAKQAPSTVIARPN